MSGITDVTWAEFVAVCDELHLLKRDLAIAETALEAERQWRLTSLPALLAAEERAVKAEAAVAEALVAVERGRESVEWASEEVATARRVLEKVHAECARHRGQLLDTEARANKAEAEVAELRALHGVTVLPRTFPELWPSVHRRWATVAAEYHQSTDGNRP